MATEKKSISFDAAVLSEALARVEASGGNLSAFVNAALARELKLARGRELLVEDERELGPVPDEIRAEVAAQWPG